tara:strand:- start:123 stop:521 length:399 start_codon:yes stop_codon:yes gene_type:complete
MRIIFIISFQLIFFNISAQDYILSFDNIKPEKEFENINVKKLSSNSNATTFAIWIKKSVSLHKHIQHTENVYISEGFGLFQLGDSTYNVKKGDLITIPKNTWHGVKVNSKTPMKVISIQSPEFLGKDRVFKD